MDKDKRIILVAQTSASVDEPGFDDMHEVGTVATILQLLKLPNNTIKVLVEGQQRAVIKNVETSEAGFFSAEFSPGTSNSDNDSDAQSKKQKDLMRSATTMFDQYVKMNKKVPPEILSSIEELDLLQVEKKVRGRVKQQMEKSQREYYLNEQMKAIQKELGEMDDVPNELEDLSNKIENKGLSKEAYKKATAELNKLKMMSPMSAEATVVRNYIDTVVSLPWKKKSKLKNTLADAEAILENDHYGLEKVKERILEYLAVQQRVKKAKGPILCLVGPPGVGKTSLGKSIARATGRKFSRMALGGVRDEAEIRGHRRTYIET